jgi:hypothetical protein
VRTWLIALVVAGCGSSADTRVASAVASPSPPPAPLPSPPPSLPPAAPPPDAATIELDAATGGFAIIDVTDPPISSGLKMADGEPCDGFEIAERGGNSECASGVCEGVGCPGERTGSSGWVALTPTGACAPARRSCTPDRRAYCGCDGKTFYASSTCPGRRFVSAGACPAR